MNNLTYTIQQVSEITGLSKQLIRKWEDRYQIITPERLDNGYRIYRQNEIDTLTKMVQLTNNGHSVKQAALMLANEVIAVEKINPRAAYFIEQLVHFGSKGNDVQILQTLQQAQHVFGVETLIDEVITPFLKKVGDFWCDGVWGEYQEALSSITVRDFLGTLRRNIPVNADAPIVLGSCIHGERHELPMHMLLIKCAIKGYHTSMLGAAPAPHAIESAVELKKPAFVLLSSTTTDAYMPHLSEVQHLDHFALQHPETSFYIGGASCQRLQTEKLVRNFQFVHSLDEIFEQQKDTLPSF